MTWTRLPHWRTSAYIRMVFPREPHGTKGPGPMNGPSSIRGGGKFQIRHRCERPCQLWSGQVGATRKNHDLGPAASRRLPIPICFVGRCQALATEPLTGLSCLWRNWALGETGSGPLGVPPLCCLSRIRCWSCGVRNIQAACKPFLFLLESC